MKTETLITLLINYDQANLLQLNGKWNNAEKQLLVTSCLWILSVSRLFWLATSIAWNHKLHVKLFNCDLRFLYTEPAKDYNESNCLSAFN